MSRKGADDSGVDPVNDGITVRYIYSACIVTTTRDVRILHDPWFKEGIYDGSWYQYPRVMVDDAIYERLTKWRRERSLRDSVPAYVVFSNKTLREIASVCPEDLRTLAEVWGVGQSRVARYGAEVLAVVDGSE